MLWTRLCSLDWLFDSAIGAAAPFDQFRNHVFGFYFLFLQFLGERQAQDLDAHLLVELLDQNLDAVLEAERVPVAERLARELGESRLLRFAQPVFILNRFGNS